jgi:hypothetical protein
MIWLVGWALVTSGIEAANKKQKVQVAGARRRGKVEASREAPDQGGKQAKRVSWFPQEKKKKKNKKKKGQLEGVRWAKCAAKLDGQERFGKREPQHNVRTKRKKRRG